MAVTNISAPLELTCVLIIASPRSTVARLRPPSSRRLCSVLFGSTLRTLSELGKTRSISIQTDFKEFMLLTAAARSNCPTPPPTPPPTLPPSGFGAGAPPPLVGFAAGTGGLAPPGLGATAGLAPTTGFGFGARTGAPPPLLIGAFTMGLGFGAGTTAAAAGVGIGRRAATGGGLGAAFGFGGTSSR